MAAPFGCFCPPECPIPFPVSFALLNPPAVLHCLPGCAAHPCFRATRVPLSELQCQRGLCGRAAASPCGSSRHCQSASTCGWSGSEYGLGLLGLRVSWLGGKRKYAKRKHCLFLVSVFSLRGCASPKVLVCLRLLEKQSDYFRLKHYLDFIRFNHLFFNSLQESVGKHHCRTAAEIPRLGAE